MVNQAQAGTRHRRGRRWQPAARALLGSTAALLALLAQTVLPPLHQWQGRLHPPADLRASEVAGEAPNDGVGPLTAALLMADSSTSPEHAESDCPICQAITHGRDLIPVAAVLTAPTAVTLARARISPARRAHARATSHGSRGPPLAA